MAVPPPSQRHVARRHRERTRLMTSANGRVMVVAAHPDDPEFLAGGTVARLAKEGREITYVIVTNGNKGSGDRGMTSEQLRRIRAEEQRRAARVLGVERVEFRPELIITLNPHRTYSNFPGWHRDHRITGGVVLDCVYPLARDHLAFPELLPEHEPHPVREVYLIQWEQPRLVLDITGTMDVKLRAIACHVSQLGDFSVVEARIRARAATLGKAKGYPYAEGFDHVVLPG